MITEGITQETPNRENQRLLLSHHTMKKMMSHTLHGSFT